MDINYEPNQQYSPFESNSGGPYQPYELETDSITQRSYAPGYQFPQGANNYGACGCSAGPRRYGTGTLSLPIILAIGGAVLVVLIAGVIIIIKKKKKV